VGWAKAMSAQGKKRHSPGDEASSVPVVHDVKTVVLMAGCHSSFAEGMAGMLSQSHLVVDLTYIPPLATEPIEHLGLHPDVYTFAQQYLAEDEDGQEHLRVIKKYCASTRAPRLFFRDFTDGLLPVAFCHILQQLLQNDGLIASIHYLDHETWPKRRMACVTNRCKVCLKADVPVTAQLQQQWSALQ
jgi:hypothetical protein